MPLVPAQAVEWYEREERCHSTIDERSACWHKVYLQPSDGQVYWISELRWNKDLGTIVGWGYELKPLTAEGEYVRTKNGKLATRRFGPDSRSVL